MTEFQIVTVEDLINRGVLEKPLDGNHGGLHPKNSDYVDEGIPFIMASDIDRDRINFENCKYITREQANTLRKGFAKEGDVLLSHKATIGRTAVVENIPTDFIVLTPQVTYYRILDESILDRYYLHYYFKSPYFQSILNSWSGSGSTRAYISITEQRKLPILLPSIDVQKRITSILRSLDLKIEINLKMNETLEEMAMTLYKHWFVDFGPFQDGEFVESELGMIPKGWYIKELNEFSTIQNGFAFKMEEYTESGVKILRTLNITDKSYLHNEKLVYIPYESKDKYEKFNLEKYDVLLVMVGASIGKMGIVFEHNLPALQNQNMWRFRPTLSYLHPAFIYFSLKEGLKILRNSSTGSAREFFRKDVFGKLKYIIPPENVGKEFKRIIDPIWEQINNNLIQNVTLTQLRDYLLPRLLSGEIDLSQAEKQVEEVV